MHKEQRMTVAPMQCLVCFRGNTPDSPDAIDDFWVLDLERDVNWGDPTYLCKYCCEKVAALTGYVPESEFREQANIVAQQLRRIHDLQAKLEARNRRLDQIATGKRAVRQTREERPELSPKKAKKKKAA